MNPFAQFGKDLMKLGIKLMSPIYFLDIMQAKLNADSLADELEENGFEVNK